MRTSAAVQMGYQPWASIRPSEGFVLPEPVVNNKADRTEQINSDMTLIQASLRQDERSFAQLVEKYQGLAARHLWHFSRDPLILEELVQDTFVEVYVSLHRFHLDAPFIPWLRTIATRVGYRY